MTTEQKIIKTKVGMLELAKQLGNVSKACQLLGYSRDSFIGSRNSTRRVVRPPCKKCHDRNRS
jgi:hypothetical protein